MAEIGDNCPRLPESVHICAEKKLCELCKSEQNNSRYCRVIANLDQNIKHLLGRYVQLRPSATYICQFCYNKLKRLEKLDDDIQHKVERLKEERESVDKFLLQKSGTNGNLIQSPVIKTPVILAPQRKLFSTPTPNKPVKRLPMILPKKENPGTTTVKLQLAVRNSLEIDTGGQNLQKKCKSHSPAKAQNVATSLKSSNAGKRNAEDNLLELSQRKFPKLKEDSSDNAVSQLDPTGALGEIGPGFMLTLTSIDPQKMFMKNGEETIENILRPLKDTDRVLDADTSLIATPNHEKFVPEFVFQLWQENLFLDVTFEVNGICIAVHKLVLGIMSACLQSRASIRGNDMDRVSIKVTSEVKRETVEAVVRYIYTGKLMLTVQSASVIRQIALALVLPTLVSICDNFVKAVGLCYSQRRTFMHNEDEMHISERNVTLPTKVKTESTPETSQTKPNLLLHEKLKMQKQVMDSSDQNATLPYTVNNQLPYIVNNQPTTESDATDHYNPISMKLQMGKQNVDTNSSSALPITIPPSKSIQDKNFSAVNKELYPSIVNSTTGQILPVLKLVLSEPILGPVPLHATGTTVLVNQVSSTGYQVGKATLQTQKIVYVSPKRAGGACMVPAGTSDQPERESNLPISSSVIPNTKPNSPYPSVLKPFGERKVSLRGRNEEYIDKYSDGVMKTESVVNLKNIVSDASSEQVQKEKVAFAKLATDNCQQLRAGSSENSFTAEYYSWITQADHASAEDCTIPTVIKSEPVDPDTGPEQSKTDHPIAAIHTSTGTAIKTEQEVPCDSSEQEKYVSLQKIKMGSYNGSELEHSEEHSDSRGQVSPVCCIYSDRAILTAIKTEPADSFF